MKPLNSRAALKLAAVVAVVVFCIVTGVRGDWSSIESALATLLGMVVVGVSCLVMVKLAMRFLWPFADRGGADRADPGGPRASGRGAGRDAGTGPLSPEGIRRACVAELVDAHG